MVLKRFILPENHFKANLFFPIMTPPNPSHHSPSGLSEWGYQEGWGGLIKVKNQIDFKIHFRWFKSFLDHFFPLRVFAGWVQTLENSINFF